MFPVPQIICSIQQGHMPKERKLFCRAAANPLKKRQLRRENSRVARRSMKDCGLTYKTLREIFLLLFAFGLWGVRCSTQHPPYLPQPRSSPFTRQIYVSGPGEGVGFYSGNNGVRSEVLTVQFAWLRTVELALASPQLRRQNHLTFNYQEPDEMRESAVPRLHRMEGGELERWMGPLVSWRRLGVNEWMNGTVMKRGGGAGERGRKGKGYLEW